MSKRKLLTGVLLTSSLVLGACGRGDGVSGTEKGVVEEEPIGTENVIGNDDGTGEIRGEHVDDFDIDFDDSEKFEDVDSSDVEAIEGSEDSGDSTDIIEESSEEE